MTRISRTICAAVMLSALLGCDSKEPAKPLATAVPGVFSPAFPVTGATPSRQTGGSCNFDLVNDKPASPDPLQVSGAMVIQGWAAIDPQNGVLPEVVVIALKGAPDGEKFALVVKEPRDDVAKHFNQPKARDSGFAMKSDISAIKGALELQILAISAGKTYACSVTQKINSL